MLSQIIIRILIFIIYFKYIAFVVSVLLIFFINKILYLFYNQCRLIIDISECYFCCSIIVAIVGTFSVTPAVTILQLYRTQQNRCAYVTNVMYFWLAVTQWCVNIPCVIVLFHKQII